MKTYTFHVSLPGTGRTWRKIEMSADQTLEDLHFAIQDAYEWDADHLYSFFMSGKAWDSGTEYTLPEGAWDDALGFDEEEEEIEELEGDEEEMEEEDFPPYGIRLDDEQRAEVSQVLAQQFGLPPEMARQMLDRWEQSLASPGDVRTTTIESLQLKRGQEFLYLFDYGDEWRFKVRVHAINENADSNAEYPRIVESVGEAPEQYPSWDEEWDEEDEEEDEEG